MVKPDSHMHIDKAIGRLNSHMQHLKAAYEEGNLDEIWSRTPAVDKWSKIVRQTVEHEQLFNNDEYRKWRKQCA